MIKGTHKSVGYYCIMKNEELFYKSAKVVGHDDQDIKRVFDPQWTDKVPTDSSDDECWLFYTMPPAIDVLKGILKYSKEDGAEYKIVQVDIITDTNITEIPIDI